MATGQVSAGASAAPDRRIFAADNWIVQYRAVAQMFQFWRYLTNHMIVIEAGLRQTIRFSVNRPARR